MWSYHTWNPRTCSPSLQPKILPSIRIIGNSTPVVKLTVANNNGSSAWMSHQFQPWGTWIAARTVAWAVSESSFQIMPTKFQENYILTTTKFRVAQHNRFMKTNLIFFRIKVKSTKSWVCNFVSTHQVNLSLSSPTVPSIKRRTRELSKSVASSYKGRKRVSCHQNILNKEINTQVQKSIKALKLPSSSNEKFNIEIILNSLITSSTSIPATAGCNGTLIAHQFYG